MATKDTPVGRVLFRRSGKWWAVELPSFPGAYSQGRTQSEAYLNLLDALAELIKANKTLQRQEHPPRRGTLAVEHLNQ